MINEFETIKDLHEFYAKHSGFIDSVGQVLGEELEMILRTNLAEACKRDYKLMAFNDKYRLTLRKKELKVSRLQNKLDYKINVRKIKSNYSLDKNKKIKKLKNEIKLKKKLEKPIKVKKSNSLPENLNSNLKREKNVKE